jgi:hypothetical protein
MQRDSSANEPLKKVQERESSPCFMILFKILSIFILFIGLNVDHEKTAEFILSELTVGNMGQFSLVECSLSQQN